MNRHKSQSCRIQTKNVATLLQWVDSMLQGDEFQRAINFIQAVLRLTLRDMMERSEKMRKRAIRFS